MVNSIIQELYNNGWLFIGPIKTSIDQGDLNALYFRFDESLIKKNENSNFFALSLNQNDRIRLINAPDQLTNSLRVVITDTWPKGIHEFFILNSKFYNLIVLFKKNFLKSANMNLN